MEEPFPIVFTYFLKKKHLLINEVEDDVEGKVNV